MRLASVALVAGPTLLVLLSPWVAARLFDGRAPVRTVATFHLLALAGMAALPLVALPCLAVVRPADLDMLASLNVIRVAQTAARALAIAYVLRVVWVAVGTSRATPRLATTTALAATERLPTSGGPLVHVVASRRPIAYSFGGSAGGVVVSRGLLALLDDEERDAVLAHELAHLRLRHHRLLRFAQVVSTALGAAVPAAADAAAFLARELEVIADQAAASQVGDRRIVARALARATLATARATPAPIPALAFGGEPDLAYRLDRLLEEPRRDDRRRVATGAVALLAAGLVAIMAGAVQPTDPIGGVVVAGVTLLSIAWLSWRAVAPPTRSPSQAKRLGGPRVSNAAAVDADGQRREDRDDGGRPQQHERDLAGDGVAGWEGALTEDQAAERVGGDGDGLVGGERLEPGRHGLAGTNTELLKARGKHADEDACLDRLCDPDHQADGAVFDVHQHAETAAGHLPGARIVELGSLAATAEYDLQDRPGGRHRQPARAAPLARRRRTAGSRHCHGLSHPPRRDRGRRPPPAGEPPRSASTGRGATPASPSAPLSPAPPPIWPAWAPRSGPSPRSPPPPAPSWPCDIRDPYHGRSIHLTSIVETKQQQVAYPEEVRCQQAPRQPGRSRRPTRIVIRMPQSGTSARRIFADGSWLSAMQ